MQAEVLSLWCTKEDLAERLGVSKRTIQRMVSRGKVVRTEIAGRVLFRPAKWKLVSEGQTQATGHPGGQGWSGVDRGGQPSETPQLERLVSMSGQRDTISQTGTGGSVIVDDETDTKTGMAMAEEPLELLEVVAEPDPQVYVNALVVVIDELGLRVSQLTEQLERMEEERDEAIRLFRSCADERDQMEAWLERTALALARSNADTRALHQMIESL